MSAPSFPRVLLPLHSANNWRRQCPPIYMASHPSISPWEQHISYSQSSVALLQTNVLPDKFNHFPLTSMALNVSQMPYICISNENKLSLGFGLPRSVFMARIYKKAAWNWQWMPDISVLEYSVYYANSTVAVLRKYTYWLVAITNEMQLSKGIYYSTVH